MEPRPWAGYQPDLVGELAAGESPRGVVAVLPGDDPAEILVEAVIATARSGRGALVCVPDQRDLDRLDAALRSRIGEGRHVVLSAQAGPADRYAAFLAVSRGACRVVIGTRAAAYAPVHDLGLVAIWDDGDDLYAEPRAPYSHTREVLLLRAEQTGSAALLVAHSRSVEAEYLLRTGWATEVTASRETLRERVSAAVSGDSWIELERDAAARSARLPGQAQALLREAIATGPVLVQTPRAGYATRLACDRCRTPAACARCAGPLQIASPSSPPTCTWCATAWPQWACPVCEGRGLRAPVVGDRRTAEEIGRSLPGVKVRTSSGDRVIATVPDEPAIVVATPGAEPVAEGGYSAVLLMDTWLLLARDDLRASEEALRRWVNAGALVRPGGKVLAVGEPSNPALQALVRWDPAGFARREMSERQSAHLPPSSRLATVTGSSDDLEPALAALTLPPGAEVLGPVPVGRRDRALRRPGAAPRWARSSRRPWATSSAAARRASCRTCGSGWTRHSWSEAGDTRGRSCDPVLNMVQ